MMQHVYLALLQSLNQGWAGIQFTGKDSSYAPPIKILFSPVYTGPQYIMHIKKCSHGYISFIWQFKCFLCELLKLFSNFSDCQVFHNLLFYCPRPIMDTRWPLLWRNSWALRAQLVPALNHGFIIQLCTISNTLVCLMPSSVIHWNLEFSGFEDTVSLDFSDSQVGSNSFLEWSERITERSKFDHTIYTGV